MSLGEVPIDAPVASLYPSFPDGLDFSVAGSPGQDVFVRVSLQNASSVTLSGIIGFTIGGWPLTLPNVQTTGFLADGSGAGLTCNTAGSAARSPWRCVAPASTTLAPFESRVFLVRLRNLIPASSTVPDDRWGFVSVNPLLDGVSGGRTSVSLRRPARAVDDTFILPPALQTLSLLTNDIDVLGGGLTLVSVGPTRSGCGQVEIDDPASGTVLYTPCGVVDEFSYTIEDFQGDRATGVVRVIGASTSSGRFRSLAAVDLATMPPPPVGITFPNGIFDFTIDGLMPGEEIDVQFTLPHSVSAYYKLINGFGWFELCQGAGCASGNVVTLHLTEGNQIDDADGLADGVLVDPGAPGAVSGPPVVESDSYTTALDTPLTILAPGVLANDHDPDGDALNAVLIIDPASGSLVFNTDGSFVYTPAPGFAGDVTFSYSASDGTSVSAPATATITVTPRPNVPPSLTLPADFAQEATSAAGAVTLYTVTASDSEDGVLTPVCAPVSGATFPLGATTVDCSVTDSVGAIATGSFTMTVRDTTPPVVTPPPSITIPATETGGARASASPALAAYLAAGSATDLVDPAPSRLPHQAAGGDAQTTLFPVGAATTVTFQFRDASGNLASATSTVTVTPVTTGSPKISIRLAATGVVSGNRRFADLEFSNKGGSTARLLALRLVLLVPTKGFGIPRLVSPAFPLVLGDIPPGGSRTARVLFDVPTSVKELSIVEAGTFKNSAGVLDGFLQIQTYLP
jgi:hypothetical protein